jgi:hypothetical protein
MAHYTSPTHLRRLFNVKSERLMRWLFGEQFRAYMAIQTKSYGRHMTHDAVQRLIDRWVRMHQKMIDRDQDDMSAPGVFLV